MADSVNSPFLGVVPADSSGLKAAKSSNSASKSDESNSFSRVLDDQRAPERAEAKNVRNASRNESTGNSLPPEGNSSAEADSEIPAQDSAAKDSDPHGEFSDLQLTPEQAALAPDDSFAGDGVTFDELTGDGSLVGVKGDVELALAPLQDPVQDTSDPAQVALLATNVARDVAKDVSQLVDVDSTADPVLRETRPAALSGGLNSMAATAAVTQLPVADKSAVAAVPVDALEGDLDVELSTKPATAAGAFSKGVPGNGSAPQVDSVLLNRSTADWLRGGAGSGSLEQRAGNDLQLDVVAELARGSVTQRGEGSAAPLSGSSSTIAGMAPAATNSPSGVPSTAASATAVPEYALSRAPDDAEFPGELTARMKTLVREGVREARLQLHPAELGRLQVTVTTEGDQTKVVFTAESSAAREAIEQSMPKLREMLEQSGLQLAESDVGQGNFEGNADGDTEPRDSDQLAETSVNESDDAQALALLAAGMTTSRIDTYI